MEVKTQEVISGNILFPVNEREVFLAGGQMQN